MDQNKLHILHEIGYKVQRVCALCTFARFQGSDWGTCSKHNYVHQKHSPVQGGRELSIHKSGSCNSFEMSEFQETQLHGFRELIADE